MNMRFPAPVSKEQAAFAGITQEGEFPFDAGTLVRRRLVDSGTTQKSTKPSPFIVERRPQEPGKQPSKLLPPIELRPNHVSRHRLLEKLRLDCALTQIVAPAGYGKSTLVAEWLMQSKRPHVWLALEQNDNSPIYFGKHLLQALSQLFSGMGCQFFSSMAYTTPGTLQRAVLAIWDEMSVLCDLQSALEPVVLVIDNYQMIQDRRIHTCLSEILKALPSYLRVVLISRSEPPLNQKCLQNLSRTTVKCSDLAFTSQETAELLKKSVGRPRSSLNTWEMSELLVGWVAGLHLVLEQSEGHKNSVEELLFLKNSNLAASHFMIETFYSAHPTVQLFMLCTSLLNQFTPDLCDSLFEGSLHAMIFGDEEKAEVTEEGTTNRVTAQEDYLKDILRGMNCGPSQPKFKNSKEIIGHLEKSGQFIMKCPSRKGWYQYHPLFARMLRSELQERYQKLELVLRDRSQIWYLRQDGKLAH
ncbi:MAG: hypothetical protein U0175_37675 [Caldilineaceae bacterium]